MSEETGPHDDLRSAGRKMLDKVSEGLHVVKEQALHQPKAEFETTRFKADATDKTVPLLSDETRGRESELYGATKERTSSAVDKLKDFAEGAHDRAAETVGVAMGYGEHGRPQDAEGELYRRAEERAAEAFDPSQAGGGPNVESAQATYDVESEQRVSDTYGPAKQRAMEAYDSVKDTVGAATDRVNDVVSTALDTAAELPTVPKDRAAREYDLAREHAADTGQPISDVGGDAGADRATQMYKETKIREGEVRHDKPEKERESETPPIWRSVAAAGEQTAPGKEDPPRPAVSDIATGAITDPPAAGQERGLLSGIKSALGMDRVSAGPEAHRERGAEAAEDLLQQRERENEAARRVSGGGEDVPHATGTAGGGGLLAGMKAALGIGKEGERVPSIPEGAR